MAIKTVYSTEKAPEKNAADLATKLSGFSSKFIVFFASSKFDVAVLAAEMQKQFKDATIIGSTTAGEITSGKMLTNSVVAMSFDADAIEDVAIGVVTDLKAENKVPTVFSAFEKHTGQKMMDLDVSKYVGIILMDGLSGAEEKIMEKIGDLTNISFIGGSAGDDLEFKKTHVFANGMAYTDAAVLALLKPKVGFEIVKTQSFSDTKKKFMATWVDEAKRIVFEFNGIPALEAYAKALGVSTQEVSKKFMSNPVGLMMGAEPYVRSPQRAEGNAMVFYCNIKEGMELHVLQSKNIVKDTGEVLQLKKKNLGNISGLINFHCILRTLELQHQNQVGDYEKIFADIPTVGFSTYGEAYLGHINQTSTMLLFK